MGTSTLLQHPVGLSWEHNEVGLCFQNADEVRQAMDYFEPVVRVGKESTVSFQRLEEVREVCVPRLFGFKGEKESSHSRIVLVVAGIDAARKFFEDLKR